MVHSLHAHKDERFFSLSRHMSKWVDQVVGKGYHQYSCGEFWSPSINFYEGTDEYYLVVDVAGMAPGEISLEVKDGQLVLSGDRPSPQPESTSGPIKLHLMEIDHGRFCRVVELPKDVAIDAVDARYRGGFLWICMPKTKRP